jgi:L-alanine-DL-glutamate epimerase-like enolase superfamily enzyme
MKIADVQVIPLSYAIDDKPPRRRFFAVLKLTTDEGLVGWGEASDCYGHMHPLTIKALVDEDLRWLLLGQDPRPLEQLVRRIRNKSYHHLGARELVMQAISAIEIALWDIRGKLASKPISELLGAYRTAIPLYSGGKPAFFDPPDEHLAFFEPSFARGISIAKIRTGHTLEWDCEFVRTMRGVLPSSVDIFVDGKYNYSPDGAIRMSHVLADVGALFFEEPLADTNLGEVARVAAASPVPLAYGEHVFTLHGFRELIEHRAARVLEPDATICGGIAEARNVSILADTFGLSMVPHCGGLTAIGMAANLHAAAAMPELKAFEYDGRTDQPLRDELLFDPIFSLDRVVAGQLAVPVGAGLGIDIDETVFRRYPYELDEAIARLFPTYATTHI